MVEWASILLTHPLKDNSFILKELRSLKQKMFLEPLLVSQLLKLLGLSAFFRSLSLSADNRC
jgi:hypothetical protein